MNNEDFQYRNTYFFVGNPVILWIAIIGMILVGGILIYLIKKYIKKKNNI